MKIEHAFMICIDVNETEALSRVLLVFECFDSVYRQEAV